MKFVRQDLPEFGFVLSHETPGLGYRGDFTELLPSQTSKQCFTGPGFMQQFDFCG